MTRAGLGIRVSELAHRVDPSPTRAIAELDLTGFGVGTRAQARGGLQLLNPGSSRAKSRGRWEQMADGSRIEWTEATWNPVTGCDQVSPGCAHCYAKTFAERWRGVPGHPYEQGFDLRLWPDRLDQPAKWARPRMIFVNSMSDLFHEDIPLKFIKQVFAVMQEAERHTFQVLTKRHERLAEVAPQLDWPTNVWIGVSIENRRFVKRADYLRQVPASVRFISAEPLLGPLTGLDLTGIDWLIAGGESGPGHRPMKAEWALELRDRCQSEGVAYFFKQWGGHRPKSGGRALQGVEWNQMPARAEPDQGDSGAKRILVPAG